jgi:hypothetical protein
MTECNHKFDVEWSSYNEKLEVFSQILKCKICKKKFFGMGGKPKDPVIIHEMHTASSSFLNNY